MKKIRIASFIFIVLFISCKQIKKTNLNPTHKVGQKIDSLHNVYVFYNGGVDNVVKRSIKNGYNIGLQYQCVEFVKRYYFEHFNHKMPDSYGHALSFFNKQVADGSLNKQRNLIQYSNPSITKPKISDLIVMDKTITNPYGHVVIVSKVSDNNIEIIQQNPGPFSSSRAVFKLLKNSEGKWKIEHKEVMGWLRK